MTPDQTYSLLDSVIKIGLGALIAAVAAHFAARGNFERELQKEHLRRRQDSFDKLCKELEEIHLLILDFHLSYCGHVKSFESVQAVCDSAAKKVFDTLQPIGRCLRQLHAMEGQLKLLGLEECCGLLMGYRVAVCDHQSAVTMGKPKHTSKQLDDVIDPVLRARDAFYASVSLAYKKP